MQPSADSAPAHVGSPRLELVPGDHVCAFYLGRAGRDEILLPYLTDGLLAGERCIALLDEEGSTETSDELRRQLGERPGAAGQLDFYATPQSFVVDGRLDHEALHRVVRGHVAQAATDGYPLTRVAVDLTCAFSRAPDIDGYLTHEATLGPSLPSAPRILLCLYELGRFGGDFLVAVLKTHAHVLLGGILMSNPYYLQPGEFLASRQG